MACRTGRPSSAPASLKARETVVRPVSGFGSRPSSAWCALVPGHSGWGRERASKVRERSAYKDGFRPYVHWVTGDWYWGEWRRDKKEGKGIHVYKSGNRYEGFWRNGLRDGQGIFYVNDGMRFRTLYKGSWKADMWHGKGTLWGECGEKYEGYFASGMRNGHGRQTYFTGKKNLYDVYNGEWVDDKREGVGILVMVGGDVYEGHFVNDLKEGMGVYYYGSIKSKFEGVWENDMPKCGEYMKPRQTKVDVMPRLELKDYRRMANATVYHALDRCLRPRKFGG